MPKTLPLILAQGTLTLFVADVNGQPILTRPIWMGARAEGLTLDGEITEIDATASGATYNEYAQLSEEHEISIDRIWVLPFGPEAGAGAVKMIDYDLTRGRYVMNIIGLDEKTGLWHQRTYYGVQAKRYNLRAPNVDHGFLSNQVFRATHFLANSGTSDSSGILTALPSTGFEQPLLFTHDDPLVTGHYFTGFYQFASSVTVGFTKAIAQGGSGSVFELEIGGSLTGNTLTLSGGSESSASDTFSLVVPANQPIRWKIISAAGGQEAGVTMSVTES